MRCDAMRPDFAARRSDDEEGASQSQSREARVRSGQSGCLFFRFTHSFASEDDSQSMRIPYATYATYTTRTRRCTSSHERARARARDRPSVVRIIQRLVHRMHAHLWEKGSKTVQQVGVTFKHPSHPGHDVIRG